MPLSPGARLGTYEVAAAIGAGGMGEVYRARDSKLNRDVALKVLPEALAADPDRLARFQREAQVLAALNHPNIAHIHGFEDAGAAHAIVMELVEGPTLADRIASGPLPLSDVLPIARQIADALEAAHEQGIVHRDLKPANIKVRDDGTVKVLDFGLAKALTLEGAGGASDNANSPTLSVRATQLGVILGTAAYMAPEQARGKAVDRRADVWAFGVVLYEMLTGERAFKGEGFSETLVSVLARDADLTALPADTPGPVRRLLAHCLERDPKARIRAIGDAMRRLSEDLAAATDAPPQAPSVAPVRPSRRFGAVALAAITVLSLLVAAYALWTRPAAGRETPARLTIALPPGSEITSAPAITRDGRTVAYVARRGTEDSELYLRDLDSFETRTVAGSKGARQPFFSPDGKWIAFFAQSALQKAEVAGGVPVRIIEAAYPFGGTWTDDNTIIYAESLGSGLLRVPASGGTPTPISKPDGAAKGYAHVWPQALPGGRGVLFAVYGQSRGNAVLSLNSGEWEIVLPTTTFASAVFDMSSGAGATGRGRLLVVDHAASLRAAPFDPTRPAPTRADTLVLNDVYSEVSTESRGWLATSTNGTAVYARGNPSRTSLVWVDRLATIEPLRREQEVYQEVSVSPDGSKAVVRQALKPLGSRPGSRDLQPAYIRNGQQPSSGVEPRRPAPVLRVESRRQLGHLQPVDRRVGHRRSRPQTAPRSVSLLDFGRRHAALR